jgi:hypothetical protein
MKTTDAKHFEFENGDFVYVLIDGEIDIRILKRSDGEGKFISLSQVPFDAEHRVISPVWRYEDSPTDVVKVLRLNDNGNFDVIKPRNTIEISCKVNGKEVPLSDISEQTLLKIRESNSPECTQDKL